MPYQYYKILFKLWNVKIQSGIGDMSIIIAKGISPWMSASIVSTPAKVAASIVDFSSTKVMKLIQLLPVKMLGNKKSLPSLVKADKKITSTVF